MNLPWVMHVIRGIWLVDSGVSIQGRTIGKNSVIILFNKTSVSTNIYNTHR